jgi:acyl-CoA synthetase (AMP-forming)/AMP-acid ligase II
VANVGGVKVWPEQVEAVLRQHPQVSDAVVLVRRNAFSGSVLTAEVVATIDADTSGLGTRLRAYCAERLERAAVPAIVAVVAQLRLSPTGKAGRR